MSKPQRGSLGFCCPPMRLVLAGGQAPNHYSPPAHGWPPEETTLPNHSPSTGPSSPELRSVEMPELRQSRRSQEVRVSSDERDAHRKIVVCLAQLRGTNVGRMRLRGERPNSVEAAVVGGNYLFGCYSPVKQLFTKIIEKRSNLFCRAKNVTVGVTHYYPSSVFSDEGKKRSRVCRCRFGKYHKRKQGSG